MHLACDNRVLAELEQPRTSASASMSVPPSSMLSTVNSEFRTISKSELEEELNRYKRAVLGGGGGGGGSGGGGGISALSSGYSSLPHSLASTLPNGGASTSLSGTSLGSHSVAAAAAAAGSGGMAGGGGGGGGVGGLSSISALVPNSISGISSSLSSHAIQAMQYGTGQTSVEKLLSGTSGITGIPPLPVNIHTMKAMPTALSQSTTMPLLSLNSHNLPPAGSTSYSALGAGGGSSLTHPTMANLGLLDTGALLGAAGLSGLGVGPGVGGITGATSLYGLSGGGGTAGALGSSYGPPFLDVASSASYPFTAAALRQASK
ncbi:hypothetical protein M5D96_000954 [Drosophila gunungcola]|uniref:Uncharacterized protein n=1 Tax=Drosophila gunungcola TaxID=103775 RepID=A0A9Q0BU84_9MUSC|nr:hypothetical protein M5D96_000954 [Drosophila gunungcola]